MDSEELRWTEPNDVPVEGTLVAGLVDPSDHVGDVDTGATLGRYVVLSRMGAGGMGVVYSAYDPQLDRRIALKLMHGARGAGGNHDDAEIERASQRMQAEAKAMAQLSHPNVITVHDVGTIDGRVFIAMEFVEGEPLSAWMRQRGRDWRQILDAFIRAGRGLEAAHAAGLVHRDFKPDNVLVGADGRVRVLDFGLARRVDGSRDVLDGRDREAGTPAYMSPEQHLGAPLDHRSDQFSFAVALYEALYGELPFSAKTRLQLAVAVTEGRVGPAPKRAAVPNRIRWALLRGLDPAPEGRWENMGALLEALAHEPSYKLRRMAITGGVAAVVLASLTLAVIKIGFAGPDDPPPSERPQCTNAEDRVAAVWNEDRRTKVQAAFAKIDEPWAVAVADEVDDGLGRWAGRWATMHRETCEASALGEQSDTMLDRRMLCLDRRLAEFDELVEVVTGTEAQSFARAGEAVRKLPDLASCEAEAVELGRDFNGNFGAGSATEFERMVLVGLERDLFRAGSLEMTGAFAEASELVDGVLDRARELDDRRLVAMALLGKAKLARAHGKLEELGQLLEAARLAAERAGADRLRSDALIASARYEAEAGQAEAAARLVREARAVLERVGASSREVAVLDGVAALADIAAGDHEHAAQQLRVVIDRVTSSPGGEPAPAELAELRMSLGIALRELGRLAEARTELEQAAALWTEHYGEQHPILAVVRFELALVDARDGRHELALTRYTEILAVFEGAFGPSSFDVGRASEAMAVSLGELGRHDEALRRHQQARAIFRAQIGVAGSGRGLAALALARALDNEGVIRTKLGQLDEALSLHQQSLGLFERTAQVRSPGLRTDRLAALVNLAEVLLALERPSEARAPTDEALELLGATEPASRPGLRARVKFAAAQAWSSEPDPDLAKARAFALEARKGFVELADFNAVAAVDRWLENLES